MLKKFLDIILIFTLALQLFPSNQAGKFYMFATNDEECTDVNTSNTAQLRTLDEEQHKEIHIESTILTVPFILCKNANLHFAEMLPPLNPGVIHTPPPDHLS